ncbi:MAG: hypothetical protein ACRDBO_20310 [Lachnospiraceae bacterium]
MAIKNMLWKHIQKTAVDCGYGKIHPIEVGGVSDSGITVSHGSRQYAQWA